MEAIEERAKLLSFPYDIGRIPCKIASSFADFTAYQWRVWTTIISLVVLKGILPSDDLNCWLLFVNTCRLLMTRIILVDNVKQANEYLMLFYKDCMVIMHVNQIKTHNSESQGQEEPATTE